MKYSLEKSPGEKAINLIFVGQKLNPHHTHFHSYDITKFNQKHCFGVLFSFLYVLIILCVFLSCFSVYLFVHYIKIICLGILIFYITIGTILAWSCSQFSFMFFSCSDTSSSKVRSVFSSCDSSSKAF